MRYLVTFKVLPIQSSDMAKAVLKMAEAWKSWAEEERKAGRLIGVWVNTSTDGGITLWEVESNDILCQKLMENPFWPALQFTVTPLTDAKTGLKAFMQNLKKIAGE